MKRFLIEREIPGASDLLPARLADIAKASNEVVAGDVGRRRTHEPTRKRRMASAAASLALAAGALAALAGPLSSPASAESDMYCQDLRASREIDLLLGAWYGWAANATGGDWALNLMADEHYLGAMETGDSILKYCP